jgi:glucose-6-phosphate isomerase
VSKIRLAIENIKPFITDEEIEELQGEVKSLHEEMEKGRGPGSDYLGWLHLPSTISEESIKEIEDSAEYIKTNSDVFISIGIGGSYLGLKATVEFVDHSFRNQLPREKRKAPEVFFAGQNISSDYLSDLLDLIEDKRVSINVISKSGTTLEPAITFRILRDFLEKRYGKEEARKRIFVTTDSVKGTLKRLSDLEGYKTFAIPDDVGGRYSVLTPVGLLPIAVSGIDIRGIIEGARAFEELTQGPEVRSNPSYLYAVVRNLLYRKGKSIEILSSFHPSLHYVSEWWKQLSGESEGKVGKGIYPASLDLTTDLHSMGQWVQQGARIIFETFLVVERSNREVNIPRLEDDDDGLNYIAGKTLEHVNDKAYRGTALAHTEGGVPNMTITIAERSPAALGGLFYFFERAIAMSGRLLGVNPFDQPGVETYKRNMFSLLERPVTKGDRDE